jgi:DNA modification methylase
LPVRIITGDCLATLRTLPDGAAQCCVTSPPYYGLRDYGHAGQIGLEETPDDYVARLVEVFREVRRVLRDDGTLWLNLGDSYAANAGQQRTRGGPPSSSSTLRGNGHSGGGPKIRAMPAIEADGYAREGRQHRARSAYRSDDIKAKDLMMIPAMAALALRADGWWLRKDIIWAKPNPMPESVTDRPTSSHEHVFLMAKSERYFYDAAAIRQPLADASYSRLAQDVESQAGSARANGGAKTNGTMKAVRFGGNKGQGEHGNAARRASGNEWEPKTETANARDVWTIATQPYSGAHFATMPPDLAERCIKAGSRPGDTILDPFGGAGTTGLVADRLGRSAILCELNPDYAHLAQQRVIGDAPLLAEIS